MSFYWDERFKRHLDDSVETIVEVGARFGCESIELTKQFPRSIVYSLQLNMYRRMLEQTYGVKVEGMFLVACHEKRDNFLVEEVSVMDEEIQALVRVRKELLKRGITTMSHEDLESVRSSIII